MSVHGGDIFFDIKANKKPLDNTIAEIGKSSNREGQIIGNKLGDAMSKGFIGKTRGIFRQFAKEADASIGTKPSKAFAQMEAKILKTGQALDALISKEEIEKQKLDEIGIKAKAVYDQRNAEQKKLNALKAQQAEEYFPNDPRVGSKEWTALQSQIDKSQKTVDSLNAKLKVLDNQDFRQTEKWESVTGAVQEATVALDRYKYDLESMRQLGWADLNTPLTKAQARLKAIYAGATTPKWLKGMSKGLYKIGDAATNARKRMGRLRTAISSANGALRSMGKGLHNIASKIPLINKLTGSFKKMKRGLFMGLGMRGLVRLGAAGYAVMATVKGIREGFANLIKYDDKTASSVQRLKDSLGDMKNALATAFAPIVNVVTPILVKFIEHVTTAATAVAHFVAALTGQNSVVVAKQGMTAVNSELEKTGEDADKSNKKVNELKRTLMGFDRINKLDSTNDNSSSDTSSNTQTAAPTFETVPVSGLGSSLAEKIKQSWANADFTDIGHTLSQKIADGLNSIDWERVKEIANKIAKSIATFLNGFLGNSEMWQAIGKTLAEGLNTAFEFLYTFATTLEWSKIGKAIADGFTKFFKTFDAKKAAQALSELYKGVIDFLTSLFENVDWELVGKKIIEFIANIDWAGLVVKSVKLILAIGKALLSLIKGAFNELVDHGLTDIWANIAKHAQAYFDKHHIKINTEVGSSTDTDPGAPISQRDNAKSDWDTFIEDIKKRWNEAKVDLGAPIAHKEEAEKAAKQTMDAFTKAFKKKWNDFKKWWEGLKLKTITATIGLKDYISDKIKKIKEAWERLKRIIQTLTIKIIMPNILQKLEAIKKKFIEVQEKFAEGLKTTISFFNGGNTGGNGGGTTLADRLNGILGAWGFGVNHFANGGVVKRNTPQLAIIGDNKREGEIVAPDSKLQSMADAAAANAGGNAQTIALLNQILNAILAQDTNVYLDGEQIKNNVVNRLNAHTRATGQPELIY